MSLVDLDGTSLPVVSLTVDLIGRASLFIAGVLGVALLLAFALRRAAARHAFLYAALTLATLAPLWLSLGARAPAATIASRATPGPLDAPLAHALGALAPPIPPGTSAPGASSAASFLPTALLAIWLGGVALALVRIGHGLARTRGLRRRARPTPAPAGFPYPLLVADEIAAAVVVGLLRPVVIVAPTLLDDPGLALVLAHERAHARRRDPLLGLLARLAAAFYWFHPCVHLAVRAIARAREESCDDAATAGGEGTRYARTLLGLATATPSQSRAPQAGRAWVGVAHDARALERRIRRLLGPARAPARFGGTLAAACAVALLSSGAPLAVALARPAAGPAPHTPRQDAAAAAFAPKAQRLLRESVPHGEGAFVLQTISDGDVAEPARTIVINPTVAEQRLTPASTYKMVIALRGLDAGVIAGPETVLPWDGTVHAMAEWNHAMDLAEAMRTSATWYFQTVERQLQRLDPSALAPALRRLRYGNEAATTPDYWMDGTLAISALEQADFQTRLGRGQLPVSARARAVLDQVTRLDQRGAAVMFGKSGTADSAFDAAPGTGPGVVVWLVGHVENGPRRHAYALVLRAPGTDSRALRARRVALTQELLALHGVWPAGVTTAEANK
jgi:beta-lactamase class D/beta-lactamase regulating signal transducer with metallopeptidase domain